MKEAVFLIKSLKCRGVQKVYLNIAKGLIEAGVEVHMVIRENTKCFNVDFIENIHLFEKHTRQKLDDLLLTLVNPILISNDIKYSSGLKNIYQEDIYQTVHMLWSKRIFPSFRIYRWLKLIVRYHHKHIITISNIVKDDLLHKLYINPRSIQVIYDAFDFDEIAVLSKENMVIESDQFILAVGALEKEKNYPLMLEIFKRLNLGLDLVVLGDGSQKDIILEKIKQLGLEKKVYLVGFKQNPYNYIAKAKLLISTSTDEGLQGSLIEALYLGTPVVSMDSGGCNEVLIGDLSRFVATKDTMHSKIHAALSGYPSVDAKFFDRFHYLNITKKYLSLWRS